MSNPACRCRGRRPGCRWRSSAPSRSSSPRSWYGRGARSTPSHRTSQPALLRGLKAARTTGSPIGFLALDVDRLKSLNDRYGHLTGAEGVRTVGHIIGRRLPPAAVACRYGGDEFAIAIPDCDLAQANRVADELREAVRATAPTLAGRAFPAATLTISVGATSSSAAADAWLALGPDGLEAGEWLFNRADRALYQAKEGGRDRVGVA
ncbi:MAG: GGDEF domain-containing protein [Acidobacteriota bacterium]